MHTHSYRYHQENNDKLLIHLKTLILIGLFFLIIFGSNTAFANKQQTSAVAAGYKAQIQRTAHNVAHITANDLPSAWFGQGYAMAEDRICTVLDQMIKIRSQRARFFGPGEANANIDSDFGYLHIGIVAKAQRNWKDLPKKVQEMLTAHAAGINTFVETKGISGLPENCRDADWVVEVTAIDLFAYSMDFGLTSLSRALLPQLSNTFPPNQKIKANAISTETPDSIVPKNEKKIGSNGWGIGADLTESGHGMLLANPHFPWEGELKLWESHITVPGEIDVYGVTLPGIPNMLVGFNKKVAWTLAITPSAHATFYKLSLVEGEPTQYLYDGKVRSMQKSEHTIDVLNVASNQIESQSRTLWHSHYGPITAAPPFVSWNKQEAMSYRDANLDYSTYLSQFLGMSQANDLDEFIEAHEQSVGMPFGHTIAAFLEGDAWYVDGSPVPNLSPETYAAWQQNVTSDSVVASLWRAGLYVLDGSTSRDEWVNTAEASAPGLIPFADKPQLRSREFVFNSNDNHWLTHPDQLLEGFDPLYGDEKTPRSLRTRANADALIQAREVNGKFTLEKLQQASLSNQSLTGKLLRKELVTRCKEAPIVQVRGNLLDLTKACDVLAGWDETFDLDSKGAVLFREFIGTFNPVTDFTDAGALFDEPFDPERPVATPSGLAMPVGTGDDPVLLRLGHAVKRLTDAKFNIDSSLREMQFTLKNDARIPVHGGNGLEGILNVSEFGLGENGTLFLGISRDKLLNPTTGLTESGYFVNTGTSFLMAVELTEPSPKCQAILAYSQSDDPKSPFYADQTKLFAEKKWHKCLFDQKAITEATLKEYSVHSLLTADIDRDGDVDRVDIMLIFFYRKLPITEDLDRYDLNKDGKISLIDVFQAIKLCTYSQCRRQ